MTKIENFQMGKAYAFFYCGASRGELERELPSARERAKAPAELELKLTEGIKPDYFEHDAQLMELAQDACAMRNNYSLMAYLPHATNEKAANHLVNVQDALYQSPLHERFHRGSDKFIWGIVYKSGSEYEFME